MKKRLIASDYDGTLRRNRMVSEEDSQAILRWQQAGGLFGMVTGRGTRMPEYMDIDTGGRVHCDFYLVHTGAALLDRNGQVLRRKTIAEDVFAQLEAAFAAWGDAENYDTVDQGKEFCQYSALMYTNEAAEERVAQLNQRFGHVVTAYANGRNINIVARGEGKAEGIGYALEHFGLGQDAAAVVGDDLNDLDMILHWRGWAMASGREQVVQAAEHTCTSIADLVDQLLNDA